MADQLDLFKAFLSEEFGPKFGFYIFIYNSVFLIFVAVLLLTQRIEDKSKKDE